MTEQEEVHALRQEFKECETKYGDRILNLELTTLEKLTRMETQQASILSSLSSFVSQHQFAPVKLIAYGLAGGVLTTVLAAILLKTIGI